MHLGGLWEVSGMRFQNSGESGFSKWHPSVAVCKKNHGRFDITTYSKLYWKWLWVENGQIRVARQNPRSIAPAHTNRFQRMVDLSLAE